MSPGKAGRQHVAGVLDCMQMGRQHVAGVLDCMQATDTTSVTQQCHPVRRDANALPVYLIVYKQLTQQAMSPG